MLGFLTLKGYFHIMQSPFDLRRQQNKTESKIVVALERIAEAFRALLWNESKEHALSPIQIQLLIFLLFHSQEKCTVSYLAQEFNMTKATISDSMKLLLQKGLITKHTDPADTRSHTISLSTAGKRIAEKSSGFALAIEKPVSSLTAEQKAIMLSGLLSLIYQLNRAGIITVQRMCLTCSNYRHENGEHYCKLLQAQLQADELRIDCADYA